MSHYLKCVLDSIFGVKNFRNEVIWCYRKWTNKTTDFQKNHDVVLRYAKSSDFTFNTLFDKDAPQFEKWEKGWDVNRINGVRQLIVYDKEKANEKIKSGKYDKIVYRDTKKQGVNLADWWTIPVINSQAKERTGYPTQKPLELMERIIEASSNKGDMVFDPFCGCATTCVAAEKLERQWVGIDISPLAYSLINRRLKRHAGLDRFREVSKGWNTIQRTDIPEREGSLSENIKHVLFGIQEGICNGCDYEFQFRHLEKDHIIPKSKGGQDIDSNLQLLCGSCNKIKGGRLNMRELWVELRKKGIKKGKGDIRKSKFKRAEHRSS